MPLHPAAIEQIHKTIRPEDTVIIAPLDWGLGHASRCIHIISFIEKYAHRVIIAGNGLSLQLLKNAFPNLTHEEIDVPTIRYPYQSMMLNGLLQIGSFKKLLQVDQKTAHILADKYKANVIISDNRFTFKDQSCTNIYITHQVQIKAGLISKIASFWHQRIIKTFDHCWIPDQDGNNNLAGYLSSKKRIPNGYNIGPLSSMHHEVVYKDNDILLLLSGPEPKRTLFENQLLDALKNSKYKICLVRGTLSQSTKNLPDEWQIINFADATSINELINRSKIIICRSGYSTIMDLEDADIKIIYVPTPGQGEQNYLASYHSSKKGVFAVKQDELYQLNKYIQLIDQDKI